jgi:hypothetical protein
MSSIHEESLKLAAAVKKIDERFPNQASPGAVVLCQAAERLEAYAAEALLDLQSSQS